MKNQLTQIKATLSLIRRLVPHSLSLLLATAVVTVIYPYYASTFLALLINGITAKIALTHLIILVIGLSFGGLVINLLNNWLNLKVGILKQQLQLRFSQAAAQKAMSLDYQQLESPTVIALKTKGENALTYNNALNKVIDGLLSGILNVVISFVITVVTMVMILRSRSTQTTALATFTNSGWFVIALLLLLILPIILATKIAARNRKLQQETMDKSVSFNQADGYFTNQVLLNDHSGETFRSFNITDNFLNWLTTKFKLKPIQLVLNSQKQTVTNTAWLQVLMLLITGGLYALIVLKAYAAAISIGSIIIYVGYLQNFVNVMNTNIANWNDGLAMLDYLASLVTFINLPSNDLQATDGVPELAHATPIISFDHVWFRYPNRSEWILKDISFTLAPTTKTAIVGRNGSGKTTLIKLLCRLYQPTKGTINLNGQNIATIPRAEYYQLIGIVFQDFQLFSYPIANNIAAGNDVDPQRLAGSLDAGGMSDWVSQRPQKEQTWLGRELNPAGQQVSGGEGQKLAIARAYYKNAPILILDEPTAALDPQSEYEIYQRFQTLSGHKSSIYISHRMGSCKFCDRILVLENGTITQDGNHQTLMQAPDQLYARLFNAQAKYYQTDPA